jgi:hypothetical protein
MGALDYFGDRAIYYKPTYESMKQTILNMWNNTPKLDREECYNWIVQNYSPEVMAKEVCARLEYLYAKR